MKGDTRSLDYSSNSDRSYCIGLQIVDQHAFFKGTRASCESADIWVFLRMALKCSKKEPTVSMRFQK